MALIEDYTAIACRAQQIAIREGRVACPTCVDSGWREHFDVDGCTFYILCETCHNPHSKPRPLNY